VIDVGDGLAVAFKVESHNHPSAVEPFQGAATGVGGILRDIVAMGARPIALLDGLRFGSPDWSFRRAVAGIGQYGNSVGVPTVGGEAVFDDAYEHNCLVNAMCVGLLPVERLTRARARGTGNLVVLYGATTGRDGIGGASVLASQELAEGADEKRPSVQIGDPFTGKKLIEASLALVEGGLVASLQDCGAAGLASSLAEMAGDGAGVDVSLDQVPLREDGMEPWEIMISESQERMVAVVEPKRLAEVEAVLDKWELHHAVIGSVTDTGELRCFFRGDLEGSIPASLLTDECPRYEVEQEPQPPRVRAAIAAANRKSKAWIYEQYDQLVQSRTVRRPGLDAAVLRLPPSYRGVAVSLDGPPIGEVDPFAAGAKAVLGAARNVACAGGEPLALTDCLNFGNPEKPEIGWELAQSIEGIAQAAEALGIPVVSGNVSLYNETDGRAIPPTPVVGCVGLVADVRKIPSRWRSGDAILLAEGGESLAEQAALIEFLWGSAPVLSLAHDLSDGGLERAIAEAAAWSSIEAEVELPADPGEVAAILAVSPGQVPGLGWERLVQIGYVR
jgi:phosphoribosylformylglycinamidine synthase